MAQLLLLAAAALGVKDAGKEDSIAYLYISPGNSFVYVEDWEIIIKGTDQDETTFFVFPSYIQISEVSQDRSMYKVYTDGGDLLNDPALNTIQRVYVETSEGSPVDWNIAFLKSGEMHTARINLNGNDVDDISKEQYLEAHMDIFSPEGLAEYSDEIRIKGRGNSTWLHDKKPYDIKLDEKTSLLGLKASSKWSLLANALDDTNVMNKLTMDLASDLGLEYTSDSEWCDLYINDEYRGNYLLCKEPGIGKGRVDISGYLIECDDRLDDEHPRFNLGNSIFKVKDTSNTNDTDIDNIESFVLQIDSELHSNPAKLENIDIDSFVERYMIEEFVDNHDAGILSYFFYKRNYVDKLYAGPCWDYDSTIGKSDMGNPDYINYDLSIKDEFMGGLDWDYLLMGNEAYRRRMSEGFAEKFWLFYYTIDRNIDDYEDKISDSMIPDSIMWQTGTEESSMYSQTHNKFRYLKFFLYNRLLLMSDEMQFKGTIPPLEITTGEEHNIIFKREDGSTEQMTVEDGAQISPQELPEYDESKYQGWAYQKEGFLFSYYIPVYEDVTLILKPLEQ